MNTFAAGIDIGGSHIATALINNETGNIQVETVVNTSIAATISAKEFLNILTGNIYKSCKSAGVTQISGIGFAMPGPFLYGKGVCSITGVEKFEKLFGVDFKNSLITRLKSSSSFNTNAINFINDAQAFLLGAVVFEKLEQQTVIGITLGTGIGSAFFKNGDLMTEGNEVPENGYVYNLPFKNGIAEDYISTRWFLKNYPAENVAAIVKAAENGNAEAAALFSGFGDNLASILLPLIKKINADVLVIGGGLLHAWHLISDAFNAFLKKEHVHIKIILIRETEATNITGAVKNIHLNKMANPHIRKTEQLILPPKKQLPNNNSYDIYPAHAIKGGNIYQHIEELIAQLPQNKNIIIDGYGGVYWDEFIHAFSNAIKKNQPDVTFFCADAALKPADEIDRMIELWLNSDGAQSIFGKCYTGSLQDFFDEEKLNKIKPVDESINILYGCGAALCGWKGIHIYVDVPKNEIQFRSRGKSFINLGADAAVTDAKYQYKRCYFIDWMVLNRHKQTLLPGIDFIVDAQQTGFYPFTTGDAFRNTLKHLSQHAFRVRPWFEPGVWGGDWMKKNLSGLAQNVPNYAWSFELITPENGLLFDDENKLLEVSFDWLMYSHAKEVLGNAYAVFGEYFPIRFDFLDTMNGDNLSVQCHPSLHYIKEHFGELITQDETYYILDCEKDAVVYLGFQEDIEPDNFQRVLQRSQQTASKIDIEKYVQKHAAKKHDLFLIPNQTIHGSGKNNMVLEISNTPYIFTFKLYDWVRLDMDGKPRPINIEHGMKNLDFSRKGNIVKEVLISKPELLEESSHYSHWRLPTHKEHIYDIERYEWEGSIEIATNNHCHILMLVEGRQMVVCTNRQEQTYHYAETVVVPAAAGTYSIKYVGEGRGILVKAFVKESVCQNKSI